MSNKEKFIGEAPLSESPKGKLKFIIPDKTIKNKHLDDGSVDGRVVGEKAITTDKIADNSIHSYNIQDGAITIDKIADGTLDGKEIVLNSNLIAIKMEGNKIVACYGKNDGTKLTIERAKLMMLIPEEYDPVIVDYYWIGAGKNGSDVLNDEHRVPISQDMKGSFNIHFEQGDYLYIIIPKEFEAQFIRADLGGIAIPFDKIYVTVDSVEYCVFRSSIKFDEGTYNIIING